MMKKTALLILVFAVLLTNTTNLQAAQVNFTPELTLSEEYTDNLYLDHDDNNKVDEYITTASLSLTTEVVGRTAGLELNYTPSYNIFANDDDLEYWRHLARLYFWNALKRNTRLELTSTYLESEDPRDQSDETDEDPAIDVDPTRRDRNRYRRSANEMRLSHQFGSRNSIYGAAAYNLSKDVNTPIDADVDDYDEVRPSLGFQYWLGSQWGLVLDAYYSDRTFEDDARDDRNEYHGSIRLLKSFSRRFSGYVRYQHTLLDFESKMDDTSDPDYSPDEDYQISAPSIGIEYQFGEDSSFHLGAGYYSQDFDESEDESGSFVDAEINNRWNYRMSYISIVAAGGYDIEDTGAEDLGLQIYYLGRINAGYNFSSRFNGDIYVSYRHDDYPNEDPNPEDELDHERNDRTVNAGAGLSYQALRWMRLRLSYNYEDVKSDIETEEFTENRFLFTVTIAPSSPFRLK